MRYQKGEIVAGTVTGIVDYGLFVQLDNTASGLVHISEMSMHYVKNVDDFAYLGEVIRVKIIDILEKDKYCLSIKNIDYRILKKRRSRIHETKLGFTTLALSLNQWVNDATPKRKNPPKRYNNQEKYKKI